MRFLRAGESKNFKITKDPDIDRSSLQHLVTSISTMHSVLCLPFHALLLHHALDLGDRDLSMIDNSMA